MDRTNWSAAARGTIRASIAALVLVAAAIASTDDAPAPRAPDAAPRTADAAPRHLPALVAALKAAVEPVSLARFHELLGSEPHIAGTPGDARQIERLAAAFTEMGLAVRIEPFWAMLPSPIEAKLEIVSPVDDEPAATPRARRGVLSLPIRETDLLQDPSTAHPDLTWGWNAFSGSGEVTAGVVFAHRGSRRDFERLRELGVDCTGKIVLIRYGGLYRGSKVRNAQDAGAAGVLLYTDPADSGSSRGAVWPDGGWANDHCIQRGSIVTLEQPGDPLTPLVPATRDAPRLDPSTVDLPRIPVQPIGYAAATQIMSRMRGAEIPAGDEWLGGVSAPYRFEGGPDLVLRLVVRQDRSIRESANVIAVLPGTRWPEQTVIVGCHHDAWGFGAADPLAGTIVLMETARLFAAQARDGVRPLRTIIFAAWGAEEFGIIGSTEWVEAHREAIARETVAYINLDMAAMGTKLGASAAPSLRALVERATGVESVGDPGGGSDHVGFLHHLSIPSIGLGAHGAGGDAYHSNYDTIEWYRRTVGSDYAAARLVTDATIALVGELAFSPILPIRGTAIGTAIGRWTSAMRDRTDDEARRMAIDALALRGEAISEIGAVVDARLDAFADGSASMTSVDVEAINRDLMALDRAWYDPAGLVGRPWWRNLALAADRELGYGARALPLVAEAIDGKDPESIASAMERTTDAMDRVAETLHELAQSLAGTSD